MQKTNGFRCIHCGAQAKDLYQTLSGGVLASICSVCNEVVDKYIEQDPVLTLLDALLLKIQAFRHILHNCGLKMVCRMTLTFFFIETLARVVMNSSNIPSEWNNPDSEFYSILVTEFLYMFTEVALEQMVGILVIVCFSKVWNFLLKSPHPGVKPLVAGLLFSYFLCNVFIPLISLWGKHYRTWCFALIQLFRLVARIQVLRVICEYSHITAFFMIFLGYISQWWFSGQRMKN